MAPSVRKRLVRRPGEEIRDPSFGGLGSRTGQARGGGGLRTGCSGLLGLTGRVPPHYSNAPTPMFANGGVAPSALSAALHDHSRRPPEQGFVD